MLKKADWRSVRKKREIRASDNVSDRKGEEDKAAGTTGLPFVCFGTAVCWFVNL